MNLDKLAPISGNDAVSPTPTPPTMLPTNLPSASPISARVFPPSEINSSKPGILERPPRAATMPAITPTNSARPIEPLNALPEGIMLTIKHAVDMPLSRIASAVADSIEGSTSKAASSPNIIPISATTAPMIANAPTLDAEVLLE